jgi:periplasmic protein TonB
MAQREVSHPDILEERERLSLPLVASLALHGALVLATALGGFFPSHRTPSFGDLNPTGGSVAITPVSKLPMPAQQGLKNPLASDTEAKVPPPPAKPKPAEAAKVEPDAVALKSRRAPKRPQEAASTQKYRPREEDPNQLKSTTGQRMTSSMYNVTGSGGVGVGQGNPFGNRFGAYAALIRDRVAQRWRTNDVDRTVQTAPPAIVTFDLYRDGSVRNVRIAQTSGNYALDLSAQRAVIEAAPLPPLPREYERESATIEFWFQLQR